MLNPRSGDASRAAGTVAVDKGWHAIKVLDRAIALLRVLASAPPGTDMHLMELAEQAGLPPSTTHRLLTALEKHGLVQQDPVTRDYRLGGQLLSLGLRVREGLSLRREAEPVMRQLAAQTGEDVYLCVRRDNESLLIDVVPGTQAVRLTERLGERMPLHRGAASRVLLAHLDPLLIEAYIRQTWDLQSEQGRAEARRLMRELAAIRERGYATSTGEYAPDSAALAAPVRDFSGAVVAALCILMPRGRLQRDRQPWLTARLTGAAAALSRRMGHLPPDSEPQATGALDGRPGKTTPRLG